MSAASPSDKNTGNVLAWLERLQASVRDVGSKGGNIYGPQSLKQDGSEIDSGVGDDEDEWEDVEPGSSDDAPLDIHVPLGLIANLSLDQSKKTKKKSAAREVAISEEDLRHNRVGIANDSYFLPGAPRCYLCVVVGG